MRMLTAQALQQLPTEARLEIAKLLEKRESIEKRSDPILFAWQLRSPLNFDFPMTDFQREWIRPLYTMDGDVPIPVPGIHMILAPRDHSKSKVLSGIYPLWMAAMNPALRFLIASDTLDQASRLGRDVDIAITSKEFQEYFGDIKNKEPPDGRWTYNEKTIKRPYPRRETTFKFSGATGAITGWRCDVLIADDIVDEDNVKTADSREQVKQWLLQTALPIVNPLHGQIVLVGTRYHYDDLYGHLLDLANDTQLREALQEYGFGNVNVRIYKAIIDEGTEDERALWPERLPLGLLKQRRAIMGSTWFNCQYQNDPSGLRGVLLRDEWLHYADKDRIPAYTQWPCYYGVDLAISESETADFTSITKTHVYGNRGYIRDIVRKKLEFPAAMKWIQDEAAKDKPARIVIDSEAYQAAAAQHLISVSRLPIVKGYSRGNNKHQRFLTMSAHFENKRVTINPEDTPGLATFKREWVEFPKGKHDDTLDSTEYSLQAARLTYGEPLESESRPAVSRRKRRG